MNRTRLYDFCCGLLAGTAVGVVLALVRLIFFTRVSIL